MCESGSLVVSGTVSVPHGDVLEVPPPEDDADDNNVLPLTADDVYKELRLRGYDYKTAFQGILNTNNLGTEI